MYWNLMNDEEFGSLQFLELKYRRGDQIIQPFCRIGCPQEIRWRLFNFSNFENSEKSTPQWCRMYWNLMNYKEFGSLKLLKLKDKRGDQIIQLFCRIGSPQNSGPTLFNFWKFKNSEESTPESGRIHWNLMNDEEFWTLKLLKLKYRRGKQIIQLFCRIGSPKKLGPYSLICRNFKSIPELCRMHWNLTNEEEFGSLELLKLKYGRGNQIIQPFCRIGSPQEIRSLLFHL